MQESQHVRAEFDGASWVSFRGLTGFVGLAALLSIAVELLEPSPFSILELDLFALNNFLIVVTAPAGWSGLIYICWIRSGRITGTALAFVLVLGVFGTVISLFGLAGGPHAPGLKEFPIAIVVLTGTWIMNGLGILWIVQKVRRIRAASNTDTTQCSGMTDVQVSNARKIKLGAAAGFAWSCFLSVLLGLWDDPVVLISVFTICLATGALFVVLAARMLIEAKKPGAVLIGVVLVPICAFSLGFFVSLVDGLIGVDRGIVDGTGAKVSSIGLAVLHGYMFVVASLSTFAVLTLPAMCLTTVWLEHKLRRTG